MKMRITLGAITKPLSSLKIKTGDWGTEYPVVDKEKCIGCKECEIFCPDLCITVVKEGDDKFAVVNYDYCKGCGVCASVCPAEAITMELKDIYKV